MDFGFPVFGSRDARLLLILCWRRYDTGRYAN